jgi:hypothetical protein
MKTAKRGYVVAAIAALMVALAGGYLVGRARAGGIPATGALYYAGMIEDAGGPIDGARTVSVEILDGAGGTPVCPAVSNLITLAAGRFRVQLDDACTAQVKLNPDLWVRVTVEGQPLPATKIGAVPYAVESANGVPSGSILFFDGTTCPTGYTALSGAAGRYLVGLNTGGTPGAAVGTALNDLEDRPTGSHTHPITDPGHQHSTGLGNTGGGGYATGSVAGVDKTGSATTGITVQPPTAGVAGTNAPYVQYLVCRKD